jgi:hypothetical protein
MVLKRFQTVSTAGKSQVHVFHKQRPPYLSSVGDVAAERDFYSNPQTEGDGALDDVITEFEGHHLAPMLSALVSAESAEADPDLAAVAVCHLALRTAHIRDSFAEMTDNALAQIKSILQNMEALRQYLGVDSAPLDSTIMKQVREDLAKLGLAALPEKQRGIWERVIMFRLRERFDDFLAQALPAMSDKFSQIETAISGSIPRGHARALSISSCPPERVNELRKLSWRIFETRSQDQHFILPDCVVAATGRTGDEFKPFVMLATSEVSSVVMPISSRQLLVGASSATSIELTDINLRLAKCSLDFFISSIRDQATERLAEFIGECRNDLCIDWLSESDALPQESIAAPERHSRVLRIRTPSGKAGLDIKRRISQIVDDSLDSATRDRIESIVVPAHMSAALESLWKRTPNAEQLDAVAFGTVETVNTDQGWACRVIFPRNIAQLLLRPVGTEERLAAARVLKFQLGRVYYMQCWVTRSAAVFEDTGRLPWDQAVLGATFRVAASYFGGVHSAGSDQAPLPLSNMFSDLARKLDMGIQALHRARQMYSTHAKLDQLTADALQAAVAILTSVAEVLGLLEAKNMALPPESEAGQALVEAKLWDWVTLFGRDLQKHYETRHRWASEAELKLLSAHFERILWTIGVVVSPVDRGHWVDVGGHEELKVLNALLTENGKLSSESLADSVDVTNQEAMLQP